MKGLGIIVFGAAIALSVAAPAALDCRGGEGGVPFSEIPNPFQESATMLPTEGLVTDFLFWEKRNALVYRNSRQELRLLQLKDKKDFTLASRVQAPLSSITDSAERYLVTEKDTYIFDVSKNPITYSHLLTEDPVSKMLFWSNDTLFGAIAHRRQEYLEFQKFSFFNYRAGAAGAYSCFLPIKDGDTFQLAEGHVYPHAFLFRQRQMNKGVELSLYQVELAPGKMGSNCQLQFIKTYHNLLPGPVKMVYQFPSYRAFAVTLDHPTKNLLWDQTSECVYYNLEKHDAYFLNSHRPYIFTPEAQGISYLNPITGKRARLLKKYSTRSLDARDLWLTKDGQTLLVGLLPTGEKGKIILKMDLR